MSKTATITNRVISRINSGQPTVLRVARQELPVTRVVAGNGELKLYDGNELLATVKRTKVRYSTGEMKRTAHKVNPLLSLPQTLIDSIEELPVWVYKPAGGILPQGHRLTRCADLYNN